MADKEQVKKIKCPHCGWIRSVNVSVAETGTTDVVRGMSDTLKDVARHIKELLADRQLDAANAWLDMPACPHCGNVYRYNVRTGEVAR
jgi:predicted RNA-binding Zn-ribbon protein involved in translation (DUF1610 family)